MAQLLALSVGAEFGGLRYDHRNASAWGLSITFHDALVFSEASWADFAELLPLKSVRVPKIDHGHLLVGPTGHVRKDLLQQAQMAGMSLHWEVIAYEENAEQHVSLSLLGVAILAGQDDCAVLCAAMNSKLSGHGCYLLPQHLDAAFARRPAATAAAHQMLTVSWKSEIFAKAIAIYQVMMKLSGGKRYPSQWVNQVMAYVMDVPEIVDQLDLWEEAHEWCQSVGFQRLTRATPT